MDAEEKGKGHSEKEESIEPRESLKKEVFSEAEWAEKDFNG